MESLSDKVLVVDDDASFARFVENALGSMGIACAWLRSGEEALRRIGAPPPRALILDGLLPGIRGDEVARKLRERFPRDQLPILFVSAFFRDIRSHQHLTRTCQVDAVLHKPVSLETLRRAVERLPSFASSADPGPDFQIEVETSLELLAGYVASAKERLEQLRSALAALEGSNPQTALHFLRAEAHRFHGSGTIYGLPEVTRLGGQLEALAASLSPQGLGQKERATLTGLVEALSEKIAQAQANAPIQTEEDGRPRPVAWLLDGPGELALSVREASARGAPLRWFSELAEMERAAREERPGVAFLAADRQGLDGLLAAERLRGAGVSQVVLMGRRAGLSERFEALRRGAWGYVHRMPDAASLLRAAEELAPPRAGASVLALDSDSSVLSQLAEVLAPHQLSVEPCTAPAALLAALQRVAPSLLILRVELESVESLKLVRAIRGDPRWARLPLFALSSRSDLTIRTASLKAGADELIDLPLHPETLVLTATRAVARAQRARRGFTVDPLSGAVLPEYLRDACDRALLLARRGRPLALLLFEVELSALREDPCSLEAEAAVAWLGARLRHSFRASDVVARVGDGRFAVLLLDLGKEEAERLLAKELAELRGAGPGSQAVAAHVRGGLASFPEVRGGTGELIRAAEAALSGRSPAAR